MFKTSRRAIGLLIATCALALAPLTPTAAAPKPLTVVINCSNDGIFDNHGSFTCGAYANGGTGLYLYSWSIRNAGIVENNGYSIYGYCEIDVSYLVQVTVTDARGVRKSAEFGYLACDGNES
ncbi:MAG: hypothetical protein LCH85_14105 [Chloroflexi bacterium]|nr:hypothetical protein [Chloroflexota bacterium]